MTKLKFLLSLHKQLSDLPQEDVEERLNFYTEMIEDRMEEGLTEEEAVAAVGTVEEIAAQIRSEFSFAGPAKIYPKPKKQLSAWTIILLAVGSPIWLALLIAAFAVIFSAYAALWSVIVSLWAVFASFIGCAAGGIAGSVGFLAAGNSLEGTALLAAGTVCAGLSILAFLGCRAATNGAARLTKRTFLLIMKCFKQKEEPTCTQKPLYGSSQPSV